MVVVCEHKLTCGQRGGLKDAMQLDTLDFNKKILHASWHPRENTIAVGFHRSLGVIRYSCEHRSQRRITCSCTRPHSALMCTRRTLSHSHFVHYHHLHHAGAQSIRHVDLAWTHSFLRPLSGCFALHTPLSIHPSAAMFSCRSLCAHVDVIRSHLTLPPLLC